MGKIKYRYERKYYVNNSDLEALRKRLLPFVVPDEFTSPHGKGINEYKVQSIYFDTPKMDFYDEKKEGLENRKKFRIRGYDDYHNGIIAFLEIKNKTGIRVSKVRAPFYYDRINELLSGRNIEEILVPLKGHELPLEKANQYLYYHFRYSLMPVNLVVYEREAYMGLFDKDIRITFDKNVRTAIYPKYSELYNCSRKQYLNPDAFVLEVKYSNNPPRWAFSIIEEFALKLKAISKYADGLDTHLANDRHRFSPISFNNLNYK